MKVDRMENKWAGHVGSYVSAKLKSEEWGGEQGCNAAIRIYPFPASRH